MTRAVRIRAAFKPSIIVSGSLAFDQIMVFPGIFSDHILPDQVHNLNISFLVESIRSSDGGTAGNIAYNLALLAERPTIFGVAGRDFFTYQKRLAEIGVDIRKIKVDNNSRTATAHIITDRKDNQIAAFYPGPAPADYANKCVSSLKSAEIAIVSPDDKGRMLGYMRAYQKKGISYIFDPGQVAIAYQGDELLEAIRGAQLTIGNDYEISLISDRIGLSFEELCELANVLVVTKGAEGSEVYALGERLVIPAVKAKAVVDPTGAGDAYRAGFIKGLLKGKDLKTCARMGSVAAVFAVEKPGTQVHRFSLNQFKKRYQSGYKESLKI